MALPRTILKNLYRQMVRIRLVEDLLAEQIEAGSIGTPCHLYVGQEAVAAGVCGALRQHDFVFGNHRSHGHYLAKGGSMERMMAEIYGKSGGGSRSRGGSMHLIDTKAGFMGSQPLVGGTIAISTGAALGATIKNEKRVVVSFFGDGAIEEGVFHESLNFAALKKLPIIYVCENNLYSTHLHLRERRKQDNIHKHGDVHGIMNFSIDGQEVTKIYTKMKEVVRHVRRGKGPVLVEARTYRFRGHVGAHDKLPDQHAKDIRPPAEVAAWKKRDPLVLFERAMKKSRGLPLQVLSKIHTEARQEVEQAYQFALKNPYPKKKDLLKFIFKED